MITFLFSVSDSVKTNKPTTLQELSPYVPLFQTLLWVLLIVIILLVFWKQIKNLIEVIKRRVETGSSLEAGPVKLGEDLRNLPYVDSKNGSPTQPSKLNAIDKAEEWILERDSIYKNNDGYFLTHIIQPSKKRGQKYDIFIYVIRHKSDDLSKIKFAEFFFGSYWGNRVFKENNEKGMIGISTSAYGSFLCTCKITLIDGKVIKLNRYIDFEMGKYLK